MWSNYSMHAQKEKLDEQNDPLLVSSYIGKTTRLRPICFIKNDFLKIVFKDFFMFICY
jgi:hypothetical protein